MKKKKREKRQPTPAAPQFKNQAFRDLTDLAAKMREEEKEVEPVPPPPPMRTELDRLEETVDDEGELFRRAMRGVEEVTERPAAPDVVIPGLEQVDEDADVALELIKLVNGRLPFDITYTDEYVEGRAQGVDSAVIRRLKNGEYAIQGTLDLHGQTKAEAREMVEHFIRDSRNAGKRCVLIVHGRGLNSKDQVPVLKDALRSWFERGRGAIGGSVLAFSSARPVDGGWGAMYVLLRKRQGRP
jgi:DNA-nicking Smr family endonuclease